MNDGYVHKWNPTGLLDGTKDKIGLANELEKESLRIISCERDWPKANELLRKVATDWKLTMTLYMRDKWVDFITTKDAIIEIKALIKTYHI